MFLTGEGTDSSTSFEQRRAKAVQYLHCFVVSSISTVTVIKPATSRSTVNRSTDLPWGIKKH